VANHYISQIRQHPFLLIESINAVCLATNYPDLGVSEQGTAKKTWLLIMFQIKQILS